MKTSVGAWVWLRATALLAVLGAALLAQAGCAVSLFPGPRTTIHGHIFGEPLVHTAVDAATSTPSAGTPVTRPATTPVRALIDCNDVSASAAADGAYSLTLAQASQDVCTISAPPNYAAVNIALPAQGLRDIQLDLGPAVSQDACAVPRAAPTIVCSALHLRPGTLIGVVTNADTHAPQANTTITCFSPQPAGPAAARPTPRLTATTSATGTFTLAQMPAGAYGCIAAGDPTLYQGTLAPGATSTVAMTVCAERCPALRFHDGQVMHAATAYLIFWLPPGQSFEPTGSDTRFEALMAQYFSDLGGTSFYGLLTQYWDLDGPITNSVTLGGAYVDTSTYPHAGTRTNPLGDEDVQAAILRAARAKNWVVDGEHAYFVFTGFGIQLCASARGGGHCSFSTSGPNGDHFCAYHSDFADGSELGRAIYAYMPLVQDCAQLPELATHGSPNHDLVADAVLNSVSHEQFEAITDPYGLGWYDGSPSRGELGDKCEFRFGAIHADGGNITLAHGHSYLLQEEWSNRAQACALR